MPDRFECVSDFITKKNIIMATIFVTALIIAIVISASIALIFLSYKLDKKERNLLVDFYEVTAAFRFFISKQEELGSRIIALDDKSNKLLFFYITNDKSEGYLIDLAEVKTSTIKGEYELPNTNSKYRANKEPIIKKIVLQLAYKNGAKPLALTFYEEGTDHVSNMEERAVKAVEWQALLSSRLKEQGFVAERRKRSVDMYDILN